MKPLLKWLLNKTGVYAFVWNDFCDQYPIRISGETPEVKKYLETQQKVFTDMMVYGMGCTQHVDPRSVQVVPIENQVFH